MGLNSTELLAELAQYKAARTAILSGAQSYTISGRSLTRANLSEIQTEIKQLEGRIFKLQSGNKISPVLVPCR